MLNLLYSKALLFLLLLTPLSLQAQFEFEPDSVAELMEGPLGVPNPDSVKFEFRLWTDAAQFSLFAQLTLNTNHVWHYRTGLSNHSAEVIYFESPKNVDIDGLWRRLDSLGVRTLPNQNKATILIEEGGQTRRITPEEFADFLGSRGSSHRVELFNSEGYRTYTYGGLAQYPDYFENSFDSWAAKEHDAMNQIVIDVFDALDIEQSFERWARSLDKESENRP